MMNKKIQVEQNTKDRDKHDTSDDKYDRINEKRGYLIWIMLISIHLIGIFVFCQGFLLTRMELENHSICSNSPIHSSSNNHFILYQSIFSSNSSNFFFDAINKKNESKEKWNGNRGGKDEEEREAGCWIPKRHSKVIILLIDALRFDFMEWKEEVSKGKERNNENKLEVINKLLKEESSSSILFKFRADPPTVTMQRLKGLTTGGMPTFIDISQNFGGNEIKEDNFIFQLKRNGNKISFLGDDTWISLYPNAFLPNQSFPFDSFNVYDLDTVDNGIQANLFSQIKSNNWNLLIAHFLGVDHVGHRYDSNAPAMATKLLEMNKMITKVVEEMDSETLLIVMGDHGSTDSGNHGGASEEELNSALFLHSKRALREFRKDGSKKEVYRTVAQVDLVPTLSLMMGVPIPFGSVGSVIPELFLQSDSLFSYLENQNEEMDDKRQSHLQRLLETNYILYLNTWQIFEYLKIYSSKSNSFPSWKILSLHQSFERNDELFRNLVLHSNEVDLKEIFEKQKQVYLNFRRIQSEVLEMCRELWVAFNIESMTLGSVIIGISLVISFIVYFSYGRIQKSDLIGFLFMILHGIGLFSNSYIEAEKSIIPFLSITLLGTIVFQKWNRYEQKSYFPIILWMLFGFISVAMNFTSGGVYERQDDSFLQFSFGILLPIILISVVTFQYWGGNNVLFWTNIISLVLWWILQWINHLPNYFKLMVPWTIYATCIYHSRGIFNGKLSHQSRILNLMKGSIPLWIMVLGLNGPLLITLFTLQFMIIIYISISNRDETFGLSTFNQSTLMGLSVIQFFFAQGHKYELNTFHFRAAFLGFETMNFYGGAFLVILETFLPHIFVVICICFYMALSKKSNQTRKHSFQLFMGMILFFNLRATMTCFFVFGARRHLMMWRVFAPKFIFDQLFLLVIDVLVLFSWFLLRSKTS
eukprot:TRINITY_DN3383_c0_g1_i2.p1 TRINITY_DN3383_c0_g1~~TRINITY_DN3383_c0_g1_i2.p1  ORF type:complete len:927 (+),score=262.12 TRINITY_DN3383_c0_g1_i2:91-2871(+)